MRRQDHEKAIRYLEKEFRSKEDYYIGLFLSQDLREAKDEGRESILDWLCGERPDFYKNVFSTIFIRETGAYEFASELMPHLDLELLLTHVQQLIENSKGKRKQRLLDLYLLYSQTLYQFRLQTEFSQTEILCLDPAVFAGQPRYGRLEPESLERFKNVDKDFIRRTMEFSKKEGRGGSEVAEYLMSDSRRKDFEDVFKKVYEMALKSVLEKKVARNVLLLSFVTLIDRSLMEYDYEKAESIVETIVDDFKDESIIPQYYLQAKVLNNKFRDIIEFLSQEYTDEEIDEDPYLKMNLGIAKVAEGNIPEGTGFLEKAYHQSGRDSRYFLNYCDALFIMDPVKAKDTIRKHLEEIVTPLEEPHVLALAHKTFVVDVEFAKFLLDYYDKTYLKGEQEKDEYGHYNYLLLLSQYYFHKKNYPKHVSVLEEIIERFPEYPGGYGKLSEFYSDMNIKEHLDLDEAVYYARKNAEIEGVAPEYFIGVCYANAGELRKCIKTLEKFVANNEVTLQYINAFVEISLAYFTLGKEGKGCEWAAEWFERYDRPERSLLYGGFQIEREAQMQKDLGFLRFISKKCRKLRRRVDSTLDGLDLWVSSSIFSMELRQEQLEKERLRNEVEKLEGELQAIKERYRKLDLSVEEDLEAFFDEIETNDKAHVALLKRTKRNLWQKSEEDVRRLIPKYAKLPRNVQTFIQTSEFQLLANHEESDFSGVILGYAKAFEVILDNKISKPFMGRVGPLKEEEVKSITDHRVRNLFPWKFYRHHSIGVGQWNAMISKYETYDVESEDKITQDFMSHVWSLGEDDVERIRSHSERLSPSRSGSVHEIRVKREDISEVVDDFRRAINDLCGIFY
ncbi:MAG: hypothetical protein KAW39_00965 [Thermoplasmata archaeon]|nr:hypothetical protein [Thermoplasmata archaeon]